jgi:glycosyltransferase involved in cell wall biosynthesis
MLEALCSGTPAIGCTGSCLEEAGGPGSAYVDPDDDIALAHEINDILSNPKRREMMTSTGKEFAKRFNEQQIYQDLMQVYAHTLAIISSKTANHKK